MSDLEDLIYFGDIEAVQNFASTHANFQTDINKNLVNGQTALHISCLSGCLRMVQYLVEKLNAKLEVFDKFKRHPLHCAIENGNHDVVKYLVEVIGEDHLLNDVFLLKDDRNFTMFHLALAWPNILHDMMYFLKLEPLDEELYHNAFKYPDIVCLASEKGYYKGIQFFLEEVPPSLIDLYSDDTSVAIVLASKFGNTNIVKLLLEYGVSISTKDELGHSTLDYAVANHFHEIIDLITQNSTPLDSRTVGIPTKKSSQHAKEGFFKDCDNILIKMKRDVKENEGTVKLTPTEVDLLSQLLELARNCKSFLNDPGNQNKIEVHPTTELNNLNINDCKKICQQVQYGSEVGPNTKLNIFNTNKDDNITKRDGLSLNDNAISYEENESHVNLTEMEEIELNLQHEEMTFLDCEYRNHRVDVMNTSVVSSKQEFIELERIMQEEENRLTAALDYFSDDELPSP